MTEGRTFTWAIPLPQPTPFPETLSYLVTENLGSPATEVQVLIAPHQASAPEWLLLMLWEEHKTTEQAALKFVNPRSGLLTRVRAEYSGRLGGKWDTTIDGPLRTWQTNTASMRHRTVHGGIRPTLAQARAALQGLDHLEPFVADKLVERAVQRRYPRTAYSLVGVPGFERRNSLTKYLKSEVASTADEWEPEFVEWQRQVTDLLEAKYGVI